MKTKQLLILLIASCLMSACKQSAFLQRKYTHGFYSESKKNISQINNVKEKKEILFASTDSKPLYLKKQKLDIQNAIIENQDLKKSLISFKKDSTIIRHFKNGSLSFTTKSSSCNDCTLHLYETDKEFATEVVNVTQNVNRSEGSLEMQRITKKMAKWVSICLALCWLPIIGFIITEIIRKKFRYLEEIYATDDLLYQSDRLAPASYISSILFSFTILLFLFVAFLVVGSAIGGAGAALAH